MTTKNKTKTKLPRKFSPLFWDVYIKDIDLEENAPFVMERILGERGTWDAVVWLRKYYGDANIKQYILKRGYKALPLKILNYWRLLLNINRKQWNEISLQRASVKPWR
ncbi:MAG: hypothetical protein EPO24_07450 [Bacteroidetes bacterium]|nr:MAG: hypothetical protein EPO24_07450 [Bacteroidota bacterium]